MLGFYFGPTFQTMPDVSGKVTEIMPRDDSANKQADYSNGSRWITARWSKVLKKILKGERL